MRVRTQFGRYKMLAFIGVFALIGVAYLLVTRAAIVTAVLESEQGNLTANVTKKTDATASAGQYVQFGREMVGSNGPPVQPLTGKKWQITFQDEFNSTSLDSSKWHTCYPWGGQGCNIDINNELQVYLASQVTVADGALRLTADRCSGGCGGAGYKSGVISTVRDYNSSQAPNRYFTYGYFEARIDLPAGKGFWPAFWLLPGCSPAEIDIMEHLGHEAFTHHTYHWSHSGICSAYDGGQSGGTHQSHLSDARDGWHTYGVLWRPNEIIWYVDGVQVRRFAQVADIYKDKMALFLNLAIGGWAGTPDAQTVFPQSMLVDYVRVYEEVDG